jgi:hypothetical protein
VTVSAPGPSSSTFQIDTEKISEHQPSQIEESSMRTNHVLLKPMMKIGLLFIMGVGMNAHAGLLGFGGTNWKEEVLLHDGQTMIVERSQRYGGRSEPGQGGPIKEHTIRFTPPGSTKVVTWITEYSEDVGRANLQLLAVHVLGGTPYIIATPNLCLSYNKWGRPNPPYVVFKQEGSRWQRIAIESLPLEFKTINVALSIQKFHAEEMSAGGLTSSATILQENRMSEIPEFRSIVRAPFAGAARGCRELVFYKGAWMPPGDSIGRRMMDSRSK